jgi:hypothetical protein
MIPMSVDTLLNFNGINGSNVFTDDGLSPLAFSTVEGSPVLSTTTKKFGTASLSLDGSSSIKSTLFSDTGIWTIECWFHCTTAPALNTNQCIFNYDETLLNGLFLRGVSGGGFQLASYNNSSINIKSQFGDLSLNTWYHVSLVNDGSFFNIFLNSLKHEISINFSTARDIEVIEIGSYNNGLSNFTGFIDDFRYTRNEILYNLLSRTIGSPTSELTTTTVSPPALPNDHVLQSLLKSTDNQVQNKPIIPRLDHTLIGGGSSGTPVEPPATSTNIISGNVKKLGLPFGANVACVSLGVNAEVVGTGASDPITGDYAIDVYPHTEEVLIYVSPEYGSVFTPSTFVGLDQIVHPTVPNRYVYVVTTAGTTGSTEPNFPTEGLINSGSATFSTLSLHQPLMNGFIKPIITPIP